MKYLCLILVLFIALLFPEYCNAQTEPDIIRVEYFIDSDPGYDNATQISISPDYILVLEELIDCATLSNGIHTLGIRAKDENGIWGITQLHQFVRSNESYGAIMPDLTEVEYFIDEDNGFGTGTDLSYTPDSIVELLTSIDITGYTYGLHTLGIRSKDADEIWGITHLHQFVVSNENYSLIMPDLTEVEYFIDEDNGFGTGTDLSYTPDSIIDLLTSVDLTGFEYGLHTLGIRSKDADDIWGITYLHQFVVSNENCSLIMPNLTEVEYFIDNDNGFGTGTNLTITPDSIIDLLTSIDLSGYEYGLHTLGIRSKDADEIWGITHLHQFVVSNENYNVQMPFLTEVEYFIDEDSGFGTGYNLTFTPDSIVNISSSLDLNDLGNGVHLLGIRSKDENNIWGITHLHQFCVMEQEVLNLSDLDHIEYFINIDPGIGNGTVVSFTPDLMWDTSFVADLSSVSPGNHFLGVRAVNDDSEYSHTYIHEFCLAPHLLFSTDISCDGTTIHFTDESQNVYESYLFWDIDSDGTDDYTGTGNFEHLYGSIGTYQATLHGYINEGCESEYVSQVIVSNSFEYPEFSEICDGESYTWRENDYSVGGVYYDSLFSIYACDSVYILNLTVNPIYEFVEDYGICSGETFTWRENEYSVEGIYYDSLLTINSCDSIYILNLSIYPIYEFIEDATICEGEAYTWRGNNYSVGAIYYDSLQTANSCDSVFVLNLTVNPIYEFVEDHGICSGETYTWRENEYSVAGIYYDSLLTVNSCDSVYVLNLSVYPVYDFEEDASICQGETYTWRGDEYTEAGTYYDNLQTVNSCDSIYILNLSIKEVFSETVNAEICAGEVYILGSQTIDEEGEYTETFVAINGCDSVVTLNLSVFAVNVSITYEDNILSANNTNGTYQWIDCENDFAHIESETESVFIPQTNGNYAVIITEGLCTDTSECQLCSGIYTFVKDNVKVYPNPANSELFVEISENADAQIIDALGRIINDFKLFEGLNAVNINDFADGVYYLKINYYNKRQNIVKLIKFSD